MTRRSELDDNTQPDGSTQRVWVLPMAVSVFWIVVSLFTGTTGFLARRTSDVPLTWVQSVVPPLVAGLIWIPLTLAVIAAAQRFPPFTVQPSFQLRRAALGHGVASLLSTFVLNGLFSVAVRPSVLSEPAAWALQTYRSGLAYMHFNAGAYWVLAIGAAAIPLLKTRRAREHPDERRTLTVRSGVSNVRVNVDEIRWIEASGDYVTLHLDGTSHLLSERLKTLEKRLDPETFVRVHRSAMVNVTAIRKLRHVGHGDYEASLEDGTTVRVSRTRRARLQEVLEAREVRQPEE